MLKVSYIGFNEYLNKIKAAPEKLQREIDAEVQDAANLFRDGAKRDLANQGGDRGMLLKSIAATKVENFKYKISVPVHYAPYVEFGTKKKVKIEPGFEDVAASAKGLPKRGDYYDFLNSILDWVKRKGIGRTYNVATRRKNRQSKDEFLQIAQAVADSIMRHGISPKPFFFKQYTQVRNKLKTRIENLLKSGL